MIAGGWIKACYWADFGVMEPESGPMGLLFDSFSRTTPGLTVCSENGEAIQMYTAISMVQGKDFLLVIAIKNSEQPQ
jgi:hypothetical protein